LEPRPSIRVLHKIFLWFFGVWLVLFSLSWLGWTMGWVWLEWTATLAAFASMFAYAASFVLFVVRRAIADGMFLSPTSRPFKVFVFAMASVVGSVTLRFMVGSSDHPTLAALSGPLYVLSMFFAFFSFMSLPRRRR
jgi:hypothetical protein